MVRIGERHHAHAVLLRARDRHVGRLEPYHLSVPRLPIERQQCAAVELDLRMAVGLQPALLKRLDVARNHADAVRVVPAQIRHHEVRGNELRFARLAAAGGDDRGDRVLERLGLKNVGFGHDVRVDWNAGDKVYLGATGPGGGV